jgi:hypothetical protein
MSQCLVDVIELDALGCIVAMNRLQTGDVTEEGRSCETAEDENGVVSLEAAQLNRLARRVVSFEVGQLLVDGRCFPIKALHDTISRQLANRNTRREETQAEEERGNSIHHGDLADWCDFSEGRSL